jgi:hypothetical protein
MTTLQATDLAARLDAELTSMAIAQFDTPEFKLLFETPLNMERARFLSIYLYFYNDNRRECWAYVQAKAPWDVKQTIWKHEEDELFFDPRANLDHRALAQKEVMALGVTAEQIRDAVAPPLIEATLMAFTHANATMPWLAGLTASHFLERRNNSDLIPNGGGFSKRLRDKMVRELKLPVETFASSNVHIEADVDHSNSIWAAISAGVTDEYSYETALMGGRKCVTLDRAFRVALAHQIRLIP